MDVIPPQGEITSAEPAPEEVELADSVEEIGLGGATAESIASPQARPVPEAEHEVELAGLRGRDGLMDARLEGTRAHLQRACVPDGLAASLGRS